MSDIVDARGLSCPQPVILTRGRIKQLESGTFTVLVDNGTAKENVIRAAEKRGWKLTAEEKKQDDFKLLFSKE
ncbi:sulfurtransferase TusA family protein [bacterium]|nr:sulfurtransferase TusA family protein [bacterium]MBU1025363.1 sulfurtransferase TusA family protein [bacterium]